MKKIVGKKCYTVFLCVMMIFVQLIVMSGCTKTDIISQISEPVIDNDLVKEVVYDDVTFKVGESWVLEEDEDSMYFYPGTRILYYVSCYGTFADFVNEDNYIGYVLEYIRDTEGVDNVLVTERMTPYTTADKPVAFHRIRWDLGGSS